MGKANETPRQKMIGIVYLVQLGLIAMSINTSVLEAFENLTKSLQVTTANVAGDVDNTIKAFEATKLKDEPVRAKPVYDRAMQVKALADQLESQIGAIKKEFDDKGGGYKEDGSLKNREDVDITYRLMIRGGKAKQLRQQINETREKMLSYLSPKDRSISLTLQAVDPPPHGGIKKDWETINFGEGIPLPAAYTNLSKISADLKNAEFEVVKRILGEVDKAHINFDRYDAVAVAPTSYVLQGQEYKAEVFLTASDSKTQAEISVGGRSLPIENGKGIYRGGTSSEGVFTWTGVVRVKNAEGKVEEYKTQPISYQVAQPSAVVSADKMNVLYIGVDNPISVSAPGVPKEKIKISATGGGASISGQNGSYVTRVSGPPGSRATFTIAADLNGKMTTLGTTEFRVKSFGAPRARFAGKTSGNSIPAVALKQPENRLITILENVEFEVSYTVNKFTLSIYRPGGAATVDLKATGNQLTPEMIKALQLLPSRSKVYFEGITATGPDRIEKPVDPLVLTVN